MLRFYLGQTQIFCYEKNLITSLVIEYVLLTSSVARLLSKATLALHQKHAFLGITPTFNIVVRPRSRLEPRGLNLVVFYISMRERDAREWGKNETTVLYCNTNINSRQINSMLGTS